MAYKPPKLQTDSRGRAYVTKTIRGTRYKKRFGTAGTPQARAAWEQFLTEYRQGTVDWSRPSVAPINPGPGMDPAIGPDHPGAAGVILAAPIPGPGTKIAGSGLIVPSRATTTTVAEAVLGHLQDEETRIVSVGEKARTQKILGELVTLFGRTPADEFRARRFKQLRRHFTLELGWAFKTTRDAERRVRRWVAWCVTEELISFQTAWLLDQVPGITVGEYGTCRPTPKPPVAAHDLTAVLPFLPPSFQDFAQVQFLCGMRPNEVARLRGRHSTGNPEHPGGEAPVWLYSEEHDVWLYRFDDHKCRYKTDSPLWKAVPKAALEILGRHLKREDETTAGTGWLLRPTVVKAERDASRPPRTSRLTPRNRAQRARAELARQNYDPERDFYAWNKHHPSAGYSQAIRMAVKKAREAGVISGRWSANQLRHGVADYLARVDGLRSAAYYLGHADEKTTRTYYAPESTEELARLSRVLDSHAADWLN